MASLEGHLWSDLAEDLELPDERVDPLALSGPFRLERIVSTGHQSPEGFWYENESVEWVALLRGEAQLLLDGDEAPIRMRPGDYLTIPTGCRHRVVCTSNTEPTVWLAAHFPKASPD